MMEGSVASTPMQHGSVIKASSLLKTTIGVSKVTVLMGSASSASIIAFLPTAGIVGCALVCVGGLSFGAYKLCEYFCCNTSETNEDDDIARIAEEHYNDAIPVEIPTRRGTCPILREDNMILYQLCDNNNHGCCRDAISRFVEEDSNAGHFPFRCPECRALDHDRDSGIILTGGLRTLVNHQVLERRQAIRSLEQTIRIQRQLDAQLVAAITKSCPFCEVPIIHYKGHGCHHIAPARGPGNKGGCPNCRRHFCYNCQRPGHQNGQWWLGCTNGCLAYCADDCDCPICPTCRPGQPCPDCDGPRSACPACNPPIPTIAPISPIPQPWRRVASSGLFVVDIN